MDRDRYDPLPDLIEYFTESRRSMRMAASHAQLKIMDRLGITADMDAEEARRVLAQAIERGRGGPHAN